MEGIVADKQRNVPLDPTGDVPTRKPPWEDLPDCPECHTHEHVQVAGGLYGTDYFNCACCGKPFRHPKIIKPLKPAEEQEKIPADILNLLLNGGMPYIA
jgi:hypothetical protein